MTTTRTARLDSLDTLIAEKRLLRNVWTGTDDEGRATACLYAAMVPDCDNSTTNCPADLMPQWLAECVPWMDDNGTDEAWPAMVRRFASALRGAARLTADQWDAIRTDWLVDIVADANLSAEYAAKYAESAAYESSAYAKLAAGAYATLAAGADNAYRAAKYAVSAAGNNCAKCVDRLTDKLLSHIEARAV